MSEQVRFSMELNDERRKILEEAEEKIEGTTKTASVIQGLKQGLEYQEKKEDVKQDIEDLMEEWNIDGEEL